MMVPVIKNQKKGVKMKLILTIMLTVFAIGAEASTFSDLLPILIGGGGGGRPGLYPGHPGRPGQPGYPGQPYPGNPGYGVTCKATDNGWEEHSGGHYSCGECLQQHGDCTETCSTLNVECRVDGTDHYGRAVSFLGRGNDQWRAQDEATRACQYNYASNCYVVSCNQQEQVVSRRSCR